MKISKKAELKLKDARLILQMDLDKWLTDSQTIEILFDKFMGEKIMLNQTLCDDCKKPIKNILDICDYVDEQGKEHCVCSICCLTFVDKIGTEQAKRLIMESN